MTANTPQELDEIREIFNRYDTDGNGTIGWDEFVKLLDDLHEEMPLDEKTVAFHIVDNNHSGLISFEEFVSWWGNK